MKEKNIKIAVIGGDIRQIYIANELIKKGYDVSVFALEQQDRSIGHEDIIRAKTLSEASDGAFLMILPLPFSRDKKTLNAPYYGGKIYLNDLFEAAKSVPYIALGLPDASAAEKLSENSILIDYARREDFAMKNAYSTVEGALAIIIKELPITIRGSVCAITGYGRIAKILTRTLRMLGATVKVFARKETDRVSAELEGAKAYKTTEMCSDLSDVDILINTVPAVIIDERSLEALPMGVKVIELASSPGGVSEKAAEKLGVTIVEAQSLPGKYSPATAAKTILESIFASLAETEVPL